MTSNCLTCKYEPDWIDNIGDCKWSCNLPAVYTDSPEKLWANFEEEKVYIDYFCEQLGFDSEELQDCPAHEPKEDQGEK